MNKPKCALDLNVGKCTRKDNTTTEVSLQGETKCTLRL